MYYINYTPKPEFDLSLLRGPHLRKGKRFETSADSQYEAERRLNRIDGRISSDYFQSLKECADGFYHCCLPSCPRCAMHYRKWLSGNTLPLFNLLSGPQYSVVVLLERSKQIADFALGQSKETLRKHLERNLYDATIAGGIEICRHAKGSDWILHSNLTISGVREERIAELKELMKLKRREFWHQEIKNAPAWHSYLLKFFSYYRPLVQFGKTRSPAFSMPPKLEAEYLEYLSDHKFSEFLLLRNIRRNGNRLERSVFVPNG